MDTIAQIALYAAIPITLLCFAVLKPRHAVLVAYIGGWMFLPVFGIKIRPQLHKFIYGRAAHIITQEKRWGGYRPQVFMQSGLAVGMWMTAASLVGVWMWVTGSLKRLWGMPVGALLCVLLPTTVLCKSTGALMFLFAGLGTLFWIRWFRNPLPLLVLIAIPPVYMYQRASVHWAGEWLKAQAVKM